MTGTKKPGDRGLPCPENLQTVHNCLALSSLPKLEPSLCSLLTISAQQGSMWNHGVLLSPHHPVGSVCLSRWKPRAHLNVIWLSWRVERQIQFASLETRFQNEIKEDRLYKSCPLKIYLHILVQLSKSKMERWEALFIVAVSSTMGFCFHSTDV